MPRYWTVEQARAALPEVIPLLQELQTIVQQAREAQMGTASDNGVGKATVNGHGSATGPAGFEDEARRLLLRLQEMGVQIKDVEQGLIDFPYLRGGEEVLLCYRLGEPDLAYWHDLYSGFAGRRPLSEL